ncbi:MAG TPA: twin-arginine translocation signal domain-containing protein [Gaiellales bacterium]|jgi:hypothetical protein|nr:twin-arginine translocation signal domain-containing protein [Gaiellales bacterium]
MWRDGEDAARGLASRHSRRGFLGRLGAAAVGVLAGPMAAESAGRSPVPHFHFCGHIFTTGSCPSPLGLPRIDRYGYPLRPTDGHPIDNLGRPIDAEGYALDRSGKRKLGPTGEPVARAPRTRLCQEWVSKIYGFHTQFDGAWYRCCFGHIRKLVDCCAHHHKRINGDAALVGYCFHGRKVFCVLYYDTTIPC